MRKAFDEKLRLPESLWVNRIVVNAEYLKWYCCPPRENVGTVAESWVARGDLQSAHYEHLPAPKWRLFYSRSLKWLPKDYEDLIEDAMKIRSYSLVEFQFRLQALRKMWRSILPKIEAETGLTVDEISRYFVKNILRVSA